MRMDSDAFLWIVQMGRGSRPAVRAACPDAAAALWPAPSGRARLRVFNRHGRLVAVYRPARGAWRLSLDDADCRTARPRRCA
jgi:sugar lactone lactonase YvrE